MIWLILIIVAVIMLLFIGRMIHTAPFGFEDETGFHFGEKKD